MNIKPKIGLSLWLVLLVVTAVVPLLLFAGATLFQISKDSLIARDQGQADTARALALAVDGEVRSWKAALTALAGSRTLRDGRLADFYEEALGVAAPHGGWIVLTVSSGQQLINTLRPYGTPLPKTSSPETINAIFASGKPLVSDVFYGKVAQGYLVAVAVPVVRAGKVVNCLTLNFYPQRLTRLLEGQQLPPSWVAAITDRQHQVIARSSDIEKRVGKPVMPWLGAALTAADHGIVSGPLSDGRAGQVAFQRLQEVPWVVALAVPLAELPSSQPLVLFLVGGVVVGVGAVAAALYTGRRITAPVSRLAQASERLLRGEAGDLGPPSGICEVRELQQALGEASAAVQGYYQERERAAVAVETAKVASAAEQALRASEERLKLFIQNAPAAIAMFDRDMRYLAVSRRWLSEYGLEDRDLAGKSYYEVFPDIPDAWKIAHRRGLAGEVVQAAEDRFERADGSVQWLRWEGRPWHARDGEIGGLILYTEDITERKQAEVSLQRLAAIVESSDDAIIGKDLAGTMVTWNAGAERLYGYAAAEVLGQHISILVPPDRQDELPPLFQRVLRGERVTHFETKRLTKDGARLDVSLSLSPIKDRTGAIVGISAIARDITEWKRMEEALRVSEQRVRLKLDAILSPEGDLGNLELADILDVQAIQSLLENFYTLARMPVSVVDLQGRVLVGVGTQEICTKFHRVHQEACQHCQESDTRLSAGVPAGEFRLYKCKNNMWDVATPIMVGGHHVGNLLSGQFLFEDEPAEQELFRAQARHYGFPEDEYLQALEGVPRMSRESLGTGMTFIMKLAHMLSQLSYSNLKLARSLAERDTLMQSLRTSEEQLRRQREWLRVTLTSIGDAVLTTDTAGRITFLNPVAERLTGWRQDDALGRPVQSVFRTVDERTHEPTEDIVTRALREGCTVLLTNHTTLVARDGREWPIEDSAAPITDSVGEVSGVVVVFHDVTEKRRAQAALRESEDRLRLAVESAELGTWDFDPVTGSLTWSDRCKALFGMPADARVDHAIFLERLHPEDRERIHALVQQALDPGGSGLFKAEYRVRWPEGTERWILAGGRAFFGSVDRQPRAVRFIGTALDITARKQAEEALHQAHNLLEQRVRERTAELSAANTALAHRSDQLRSLAAELTLAEQRERKRLATVLHDEHQQLLVAAKIRVSLLERMADPRVRDAGHEVAALLQEAIENARSLTRELSPPVSLTGGLAPAVDWLVRWMEQKYHLAVETQVDETAVPASDELTALLFQSMRELLFNIVKHTTVQTARVEIAREAGQLRLSVSDAGGGFYPPDLRVEGGTGGGFGLFSIRQRVELLGGRLDIDSGYGRGSRFTLWVPLRPEPAEHPAGAPVPKRSAGKQGKRRGKDDEPALKKVRVLLADDHTMVRQALARMLSQEPDIEVVGEASDGKLAVELTRQLHPDVVAMDVNMPVMDGIQATQAIHAEFPDVRVIGLSMLEEGEERSAMREAGAVGHLSKSGPSEALTAAIRACIRGG